VGFILLGEALAKARGAPIDALFEARVARPLGLSARFRRLSASHPPDARVQPTGATRPREPAPGQEGMWEPFKPTVSPPGEVDDDNAWAMDGVAGHAGLFGTAADVARLGQFVLESAQSNPRWARMVERDPVTPGSTRAMGFDTPSEQGSQAGHHFGRAVGHTGFTGISLWIELSKKVVVALCSNRTYKGRANVRIKEFRPRFHDAVMQSL